MPRTASHHPRQPAEGWAAAPRRLTLALALLCCIPPGSAADFYIAPTGSDARGCTNATTDACASFKRCNAVMSAGDTCFAKGGSYTTSADSWLITGNGGAQGRPKTFRGAPGESAVIRAPELSDVVTYVSWRIQSTDNIVISDLTIYGTLWFDTLNGGDGESDNITITRNRFDCPGFQRYRSGNAVTFNQASVYISKDASTNASFNDNFVVRDNYFQINANCPLSAPGMTSLWWIDLYKTNNAIIERNDFRSLFANSTVVYYGVYVKEGNQNATVRYNYFKGVQGQGNVGWAINHSNDQWRGSAGGNAAYQNVIVDAGGVRFYNNDVNSSSFYNNTIFRPSYSAVDGETSSSLTNSQVFNNIIWGDPAVNGERYVEWVGSGAVGAQQYFDNNIYYPTRTSVHDFVNAGTTYDRLSDWQNGLTASGCGDAVNESSSRVADPRFVNPSALDFHLAADSPARTGGRGGAHATVLGAYILGNEQIGCSFDPQCYGAGGGENVPPGGVQNNHRAGDTR